MKIASVAEIKSRFSTFLRASEGGPVVVTRNGKAVAVIVSVSDEEEIERLLMAYSPRLRALLDSSHGEIREGAALGHEEFWEAVRSARTASARPRTRPRS